MAGTQTVPLTVQDIQDYSHSRYEQATDTPALTDDDGLIRMRLINEGINAWEESNDVRWRELWVYNQSFGPIVAGKVVYTIDLGDFRELGGRIRFLRPDGSRFYVDVVSQEDYARYINQNEQVVAVSGNNNVGYQLNLGWVPVAGDGTVGATGYYDYYKYANRMQTMTDVPEMSNPYFLVDYVTAGLFVTDDINLYTKFNTDAQDKLAIMKADNEALPPFASNAVGDVVGDANIYAMG